MTALLDVNVLVSLAWRNHVHHSATVSWFRSAARGAWATSPQTQAGFIRVSANRRVLADASSPAAAAALLGRLCALDGHEFWVDDVALATAREIDLGSVSGHRQVTDAHLLALVRRHDGRLVTYDRGAGELGAANHIAVELLQS